MAYEQKDNSGTLGRNKRKEKESHPDHSGSCVIGGAHYWISAWVKENGSTNEKFFSLSFKEKDVIPDRVHNVVEDIDGDIPF